MKRLLFVFSLLCMIHSVQAQTHPNARALTHEDSVARESFKKIALQYVFQGGDEKAMKLLTAGAKDTVAIGLFLLGKKIEAANFQKEKALAADKIQQQQKQLELNTKQLDLNAKQLELNMKELELKKRELSVSNEQKALKDLAYLKTQADLKQEQAKSEEKEKLLGLTEKEKELQKAAYLKTQDELKDERMQKEAKEKLLGLVEREKRLQQENAFFLQKQARTKIYILIASLAFFSLLVLLLWRNNLNRRKANTLLLQQKEELQSTLVELKATQSQLIQKEKMASLGELTAGIAHEIQNPLNFVNNFSEANMELMDELQKSIHTQHYEEAWQLTEEVKQNEQKINHHGKRAASIVKAMLQHSGGSEGEKEPVNLNALIDEYLRLAYHGFKAKNKAFNAIVESHYDADVQTLTVSQQEIGRVLLNLFNNAFYAVNEKKKQSNESYEPMVSITTKKQGGEVLITVTDNGNGVPQKVIGKLFQPFFTTKPTGEGTGLGLSLSYDIITKGHNGHLKVATKEGEYATFVVHLPV